LDATSPFLDSAFSGHASLQSLHFVLIPQPAHQLPLVDLRTKSLPHFSCLYFIRRRPPLKWTPAVPQRPAAGRESAANLREAKESTAAAAAGGESGWTSTSRGVEVGFPTPFLSLSLIQQQQQQISQGDGNAIS
jgi:hypothetical protein